MTDVLTPEQRSYCMSRIRDRDTKPELAVRRIVHALGFRYRLHVGSMPGTPDLVFPKHRKVILVHGCFWHRHTCRFGRVRANTNARFWEAKILANKERDRRIRRELRAKGWETRVVWECQTRQDKSAWLLDKLARFLAGGCPGRS